ncbi:hypothetical protein [Streptomyces sp. NPDC050485]
MRFDKHTYVFQITPRCKVTLTYARSHAAQPVLDSDRGATLKKVP